MNGKQLILAIESAVAAGSICLLADGIEIGSVCGESATSRAEDLLPNIAKLLENCGRELNDIRTIAISSGPGSFTGIRIGAATALGLARSLGIEQRSISVLSAMAISNSGKVMAAVPTGRHDLAYGVFDVTGSQVLEITEPAVIEKNVLNDAISTVDADVVLLHRHLYEALGPGVGSMVKTIVDCGLNLAFLIGQAVTFGHGNEELEPQYLHNPARHRQLT